MTKIIETPVMYEGQIIGTFSQTKSIGLRDLLSTPKTIALIDDKHTKAILIAEYVDGQFTIVLKEQVETLAGEIEKLKSGVWFGILLGIGCSLSLAALLHFVLHFLFGY